MDATPKTPSQATAPAHTAGPWIIDGKRIRTQAVMFEGAERGATVAQVDKGAVGSEQARANAMLIAASPELLAACRTALSAIQPALTIPLATMTNEHLHQINERIVQASVLLLDTIARAEGRQP